VKFKSGFGASSASGGGSLPLAPVVVEDEPDLTPPPQPTGFVVTAAISHVFIEHDAPLYRQGHGHQRTRVYGAIVEAGDPLPTFDDAVEVGQFSGQVWAMPSNPATTWRLWIKWETNDGVLSPTPAGGTNGLEAVTGQDVALLLEALTGEITESQLYQDLGARIDLIDGPDSLAGSVAARIKTEQTARETADGALSQQITTLQATANGNTAAIQTEATARANADSSLATQINTVSATANTKNKTYRQNTAPTSGMVEGDLWFDADDSNKAYRYTGTAWTATDDARIAANAAAIQTEATTRANADSANATAISQVQARLNTGDYAVVKTESSTNASKVTGLEAKYTVKIDVNGYVSGFGLASTANNATPFSDFAIRADKFYIANPSGPGVAPAMPFIVRTTATTIGGVSVPVGVYMADAFIQNGTITNAKIANLAVDNAKIANLSADKLTAGSIAVGQHIQSSNYVASSQGWKINGNGSAEFASASIRGQLTASQIDSRGLTIKDANGNVIFGSGGVDYSNVIGSKPPSNATRNAVFSSPTAPSTGAQEGDFWNDTSNAQAKVWTYLSGAWRLTGTEGATFASGAGQISGQISSTNISTFIAGAAIGTAYISNAAITSAKIQDAAITSAKIQDAAITSAKIQDAAITSAKIGNAEIGTLKIAGNAVTVPSTLDILSNSTTITRKDSPFSSWQQVGSLSVSFDITPIMVAVFGTVNVLTAGGGPGVAALFARVRESVSGTTSPPIGVVTDSSSNIVITTGLSGIGTGSRTFVLEITRDNSGFNFLIGDANITVLGAKR
jgi:hypothetical protein